MSDDRPLVTVKAYKRGPFWDLEPMTNGPIDNGLYLMLPLDSLTQAADICMDIGRGMAARSTSDRGGKSGV